MSQYSDHEEEEEEEAAATTTTAAAVAAEVTAKKEDERVMRRSSVEGSEETKPGTVAFIRRKRRSTTEGELLCERTRGLQREQGWYCSSHYTVQLPQGRPATAALARALFTLKLPLCPCMATVCVRGTCLSMTPIWPGSNYRT